MSDNHPRIVVLDRDGVINHESAAFIKSTEEWEPLPGSLDAIAALCHAGFIVTVATNQSGVGRGLLTAETLSAIHEKMIAGVKTAGGNIDAIFICPHRPDEGCRCRKPNPGMLHQVADKFSCRPADMLIIGDSIRDLQAAEAFGARPILVRTGNGQKAEKLLAGNSPVRIFENLADAARALINGLP